MVEGQDFTTRFEDPLLGGCGKSESSYGEFGNFDEADIVCDCSDDNDDFAVTFRS